MKTIYGIVAELRFSSLVLAAAMFAVVARPVNAADESIKEKAAQCTPCHGEAGISETENTPSLAGQPDQFLQWQLVFFRSSSRKSEVMQPLAEQINNEDIRNLGAYFASLTPPKTSAPDDNPDLSRKGAEAAAGRRCGSCHGDTFAGTKAVARLAGQRENTSSRRCMTTNQICGSVAAWRRWQKAPIRSAKRKSSRSRTILRTFSVYPLEGYWEATFYGTQFHHVAPTTICCPHHQIGFQKCESKFT
jgi:cytochrome c553